MQLETLRIDGLYGSLNLNVKFHQKLNLLVGINGSGKTSALAAIDWLLGLNLQKLCTTSFTNISLTFLEDGLKHCIEAKKNETDLNIHLTVDDITFDPIHVKLRPANVEVDDDTYSGLRPEEHEEMAWRLIKGLRKPVVVSLERTITAEVDNEIYYDLPRRKVRRARAAATPIEYVQDLFSIKYADYRREARNNDNQLKSRIILTALHSPASIDASTSVLQLPLESAESLENKVQQYLSASMPFEEDVGDQVRRFFEYFREMQKDAERASEGSGKLIDLIQSQLARVHQLARAFNEFEKSNATAFSRLRDYLDAVNPFLRDSGKVVMADDIRGGLVFKHLKDGKPYGEATQISKLSSGETQILILFALIAFEASDDSVFIVDEPELSLHPKWQTDFMNSFLSLAPPKAQLLVATHSPEIAAGRKTSSVFF